MSIPTIVNTSWIQAVIDGLESKGSEWLVYVDDGYIEFEQRIGQYSYDFVFGVWAKNIDELYIELSEYYENFDVDEETILWVNSLGKNGVPPTIRELLGEMEECESELEQLVNDVRDIRYNYKKEQRQ